MSVSLRLSTSVVYFYIVFTYGIMLVGHGAVGYIIASPGRVTCVLVLN